MLGYQPKHILIVIRGEVLLYFQIYIGIYAQPCLCLRSKVFNNECR